MPIVSQVAYLTFGGMARSAPSMRLEFGANVRRARFQGSDLFVCVTLLTLDRREGCHDLRSCVPLVGLCNDPYLPRRLGVLHVPGAG